MASASALHHLHDPRADQPVRRALLRVAGGWAGQAGARPGGMGWLRRGVLQSLRRGLSSAVPRFCGLSQRDLVRTDAEGDAAENEGRTGAGHRDRRRPLRRLGGAVSHRALCSGNVGHGEIEQTDAVAALCRRGIGGSPDHAGADPDHRRAGAAGHPASALPDDCGVRAPTDRQADPARHDSAAGLACRASPAHDRPRSRARQRRRHQGRLLWNGLVADPRCRRRVGRNLTDRE